MTEAQKIVAISDPENMEATGLIVYWSLIGGDADHAQLTASLVDHGIKNDDAPKLPTPRVAFARAVKSFASKSRVVRRSQSTLDTFYICDQVEMDGTLTVTTDVKLTLNKVGVIEAFGFDPDKMIAAVKAKYETQLMRCAHNDVSKWLTHSAFSMDAISLRATGGFYFIPAHTVDAWRNLVDAVHNATRYKINEIPAMRTEETVEALLDAITREAEMLVSEIEADLAVDGLGALALRSRSLRACAMSEKVARYEGLLEQRIGDFTQKLVELDAAAVTAALKADMEKDSK